MELTIRRANPSDALFLTSISFGAERYWNYSEEYLDARHDELTITEDYIAQNIVFVAQKKATIIGYCSISHVEEDKWKGQTLIKAGYWLDHIFIRPAYIRSGIGTELIEELVGYCKENNINSLNILSDPNANGFYDKIGARYICDLPSNMEGRCVCLFEFAISPEAAGEEETATDEIVGEEEEVVEAVEEDPIKIATISREAAEALLAQVEENENEKMLEPPTKQEADYLESESMSGLVEESVVTDEEKKDKPDDMVVQQFEDEIQNEENQEQDSQIEEWAQEIKSSIEAWSQEATTEIVESEEPIENHNEGNEVKIEDEESNIFDAFKFQGKSFETQVDDLEEKRMQVEQEALEQKLYELDKDADEDELYDFLGEQVSESECKDEEYGEDEEYESYIEEEMADRLDEQLEHEVSGTIENFKFTTPIGYKFQCEEEQEIEESENEESEEVSLVQKQNANTDELDEVEDKEIDLSEEVEQIESTYVEEKAQEIEESENEESEEVSLVQEQNSNTDELDEVEDKEVGLSKEADQLSRMDELQEGIQDIEVVKDIYDTENIEAAQDIESYQEREATTDSYEAVEITDEPSIVAEEITDYARDECSVGLTDEELTNEEEIHEELQYILERISNEKEENQQALDSSEGNTEETETVHISSEKEKMLEGEQYIAWGDEIVEDRRRARKLLKEFNLTDPENKKQASTLLKELFGDTGEYIHIEPDFKCNYGYNIHIGDNFYAGYNCVILDNAKVSIGDNCIMSPQVGIYTLAYPINTERRVAGYEYAKPVIIGNNVWIGGGTVINPGVTIGNDVVIAPGSVIISDIPDHVVVGGNPAKVIKEIDE